MRLYLYVEEVARSIVSLSPLRLSFVGLRLVRASNPFVATTSPQLYTTKSYRTCGACTLGELIHIVRRAPTCEETHSTIQREHLIYKDEKERKRYTATSRPNPTNTQYSPIPGENSKQNRKLRKRFPIFTPPPSKTEGKDKNEQYETSTILHPISDKPPSPTPQRSLSSPPRLSFPWTPRSQPSVRLIPKVRAHHPSL